MEKKNPIFNTGLDYCQRISDLIRMSHNELQRRNYDMVKDTLQSLEVELTPRMINNNISLNRVEKYKLNINVLFEVSKHNQNRKVLFPQCLWEYFNELNKIAHELNLIMLDKTPDSEATDV